jgi:hypothetical protein
MFSFNSNHALRQQMGIAVNVNVSSSSQLNTQTWVLVEPGRLVVSA